MKLIKARKGKGEGNKGERKDTKEKEVRSGKRAKAKHNGRKINKKRDEENERGKARREK